MSSIVGPKINKSGRGRGRGVLALTSYEPCPRPSVATIGSWHLPKKTNGPVRKSDSSKEKSNYVANTCDNYVDNSRIKTNTGNMNGSNRNVELVKTNGNNRNVELVKTNGNNGNNRNGYRDNSHFQNTNELKKQDIRNNTSNVGRVANNHRDLHTDTSESKVPPKLNNKANILAKYNYKANPAQPGGFPELTIKQGEKLMLIRKGHEETNNHLWWEVRNENGEQGFVPGTFCMILEQEPSSLPWLENKRMLEEKERRKEEPVTGNNNGSDTGFGKPTNGTPSVKQYQSAYNSAPATNVAEANKEFFCEVCDKNLNGPIPYKSHMSSKAHREEVEYHRSKEKFN